jgi:hypothetical protein
VRPVDRGRERGDMGNEPVEGGECDKLEGGRGEGARAAGCKRSWVGSSVPTCWGGLIERGTRASSTCKLVS